MKRLGEYFLERPLLSLTYHLRLLQHGIPIYPRCFMLGFQDTITFSQVTVISTTWCDWTI